CLQVEVLKRHAVKEDIVGQQLLAADVDGVFRQIERLAQRDVAGGQLNLRRERLLCARRKHHSAVVADAELEVAQKARVIVEETDVGSARRHDVASDGGG